MHLYRKILWLLPSILFTASCSEQEHTVPEGNVPATFTIRMIGESTANGITTRAANDTWDTRDKIGIYMVSHDATQDANADFTDNDFEDCKNVQYQATPTEQGANLTPVDAPMLYPTTGEVNFVAYYPYQSDMHTKTEHTHIYQVDVSDQNPLSNIDLLYHKGMGTPYSRTTPQAQLTFTHQLSKITVNITPAEDIDADLSESEIMLVGFPTEATFNLSSGALAIDTETTTDITPVSISTAAAEEEEEEETNERIYEAILIPCSGEDYTRSIRLTFGNYSYSYMLPEELELEQGKAYSYNFTYTGRAIHLTGATITNWNEGGTTNGNIGDKLPDGWDDDIDWDIVVFDGESNCYIVPPNGQLIIPISRAKTYHEDYDNNFPALGPNEEFYTKVYWSDNTNAIAVKDETTPSTQITTIGTGPEGYILVKPGDGSGNAIVALQKKNEDDTYTTLWSWHVWVTDYVPATRWMDRNLGATNNRSPEFDYDVRSFGLYYQWGRKDPFPGTTTFETTSGADPNWWIRTDHVVTGPVDLVTAIQNPDIFYTDNDSSPNDWLSPQDNTLWGNSKTIYDPCPNNYKIPERSINTWGTINMTNATDYMAAGWYESIINCSQYNANYGGYYPASGSRARASGRLASIGTYGFCWSVTDNGLTAYSLSFTSSIVYPSSNNSRAGGFSIRCIAEDN